MKTAFFRNGVHGNIIRKVFSGNETVAELAKEIRRNGFSVLKIYAGSVSYEQFDDWYFLNRKK